MFLQKTKKMEQDIERCIEVLKQGGLILYPTDTIWGIGCDATNSEAVRKVYELKHRADNKALIVLLDSENSLYHHVVDVPEMALELLDVAVRPLTIIYEGAYNVAPELLGENESVGIRIPHDKFAHELCRRFRRPIVSTSANVSGEPSPGNFQEISKQIIDGVDYAVNYRRDDRQRAEASNVILLRADGTFKIIR